MASACQPLKVNSTAPNSERSSKLISLIAILSESKFKYPEKFLQDFYEKIIFKNYVDVRKFIFKII